VPALEQPQPAPIFNFKIDRRVEGCNRCLGGGVNEVGMTAEGIPVRIDCVKCEGLGFVRAPFDRSDKAKAALATSRKRGP